MTESNTAAARDQLFWTLCEHSETDPERLQQLTNMVQERKAIALYQSSLRALSSDCCATAISSVVAELENASSQEEGHLKIEVGTAKNSAACMQLALWCLYSYQYQLQSLVPVLVVTVFECCGLMCFYAF